MSAGESSLTPALVEQRLARLEELCALGDSLLTAELPPLSRETFEARALGVEGRVHESAIERLPRSFRKRPRDARDVVLWASFSGSRHELAWSPDIVVDVVSGQALDRTRMILVAVTQQFDRPVDAVDAGWKTIVTLRVLGERSAALEALPALDAWDHRTRLWVGSARDHARTVF